MDSNPCPFFQAFICHGEIYMAAGCYEMALMFFGLAAELNPMMEVTDDLLNLVKRASVLGKRSRMSKEMEARWRITGWIEGINFSHLVFQ